MIRLISSYTTRCCASTFECFELFRSRFGFRSRFFVTNQSELQKSQCKSARGGGHSHAAQVPRRCRDTAPPASACARPPLPRCPSMVAGPQAFINSVCVPRAPPLRACVGIPPPFFPPGASSVIAPQTDRNYRCEWPRRPSNQYGLFVECLRSTSATAVPTKFVQALFIAML